jgi:hypothetical protein
MSRPKLTPEIAFNLAVRLYDASGERDERLESVIAQDAQSACWYAERVLKGPWLEAESVIAQDPACAYRYALYVLRSPWPEAEPVIVQDPRRAYWYARYLLETPEDVARFQAILGA